MVKYTMCRNYDVLEEAMITGDLRNKIERIQETFRTGGKTNPLDVIKQFTYLLFIKQLYDMETIKVEYERLKVERSGG